MVGYAFSQPAGNGVVRIRTKGERKMFKNGSIQRLLKRTRAGFAICGIVAVASLVAIATAGAADGDWGWALPAGGTGSDEARDIAMFPAGGCETFPDGGTFVTGSFQSSATFIGGETLPQTLAAAGASYDIFVAMYGPDGTLAWAQRAGGTGFDEGYGVTALEDGSALVTGYFSGSATFGGNGLVSAGADDVFIAKYNPDGSLAWVTDAGGTNFDAGQSIGAFADGTSVITGRFQGDATFGAGSASEVTLSSAGGRDTFVAMYNPGGALVWARRAGGTGSDEGWDVAAASDGSVYVTGYFDGAATFQVDDLSDISLGSAGNHDMFVARYLADGTLDWVTSAGGSSYDQGRGVAALADGGAVVSGYIRGVAYFDDGTGGSVQMVSAGVYDAFVAKYNPDGTLAWVSRAGGTSSDRGYDVTAISDGTALVTGSFADTAVFGLGEAGETTLTSEGLNDVFVAKYAPENGTLVWARRAGGTANDESYSISTTSDGTASLAGSFKETAIFGTTELTAAGNVEIFIATIGAEPSTPSVLQIELDLKPGGGNNVINLGSNGVIPIAIVSTAEFDATQIDPATVVLSGASVAVRGKGSRYMASEKDVNGDGLMDLELKIDAENLDPDQMQDGYIYLYGETYDGLAFEGWDEVVIVPEG